MKIIFEILSKKEPETICPITYTPMNDNRLTFMGPSKYPINGILPGLLKKDESIKVVILRNNDATSQKNEEAFLNELKNNLKDITANIEHNTVEESDNETIENFNKRFIKLLDQVEENSEILLDITYGQKTQPLVAFSVLSFAERFYSSNIAHIIYGSPVLAHGIPVENGNHKLFDITSLYYLNNMANVMDAPNGETAKRRLAKFFNVELLD